MTPHTKFIRGLIRTVTVICIFHLTSINPVLAEGCTHIAIKTDEMVIAQEILEISGKDAAPTELITDLIQRNFTQVIAYLND